MKNLYLFLIALTIISCDAGMNKPAVQEFTYPETKKVEQTDDYFGTSVSDPYRWLENDTAADTEAWVKEQNKVTFDYLSAIPFRESLRQRYEDILNFPKLSSPRKAGEYYFFYKNDGLQNQSVIYFQKGLEGEPEVFIDPNALSEDGTVSINLVGFSEDYKYVAYSRSDAGSDWRQIRVMEIATKTELPDVLEWVKFSGAAWKNDGFYYSRYPQPEEGAELSASNQFHTVYYHKLGTPQSEDELIYKDDDHPNYYHWTDVTEDREYLILYVAEGTDGYECHYQNITNGHGDFTPLFTGFENKSDIIDHMDGKFLVKTNIEAPNYRLVSIDLANTAQESWSDVIPQGDNLLDGVGTAGGYIFADYLENAMTKVYRYNYDGSEKTEIELPAPGSAGGFYGHRDDDKLFYTFTSFTYPPTIFQMDVKTGASEVFYTPELKFDPAAYESKQVWYKSKDGTEVSMFIVHKKGLELNGNNPTYLYGYGGFNISLTPSFSVSRMLLLENGGVFAMPNLRGGGEYGEEWHKAGMLLNKQNVFDDFIGAAEYLIAEKYTSNEMLAIAGGSNGGLLVGACMTQRPDLFKVAMPAVGVLDMLRYHLFTVGKGWIPEYGSSDEEEHFKNLVAYSPLHNIKPQIAYPATLIFTGDHDDRVVPAHSFKFAATLQEHHNGTNPVMIRIETDAGHGAGKPMSKIIEEQSDRWAFMFYNMGVTPKDYSADPS